MSGVSLGFGLLSTGEPGDTLLAVDLGTIKSGIGVVENTPGSFALGPNALQAVSPNAQANTAFGNGASSQTTTGGFNTAMGKEALTRNTAGYDNTALGAFAITGNISGGKNTAVGVSALERALGNNNTALGTQALGFLRDGSDNIGIGYGGGTALVTGSNNIYLGNAGVNTENFTTRIGRNVQGGRTFIHGIRGVQTGTASIATVLVDSAGQLGTAASSRRYKEDIADLGDVARDIQRLRPVTFRYRQAFADGTKPLQYGLIAEEVADVLPTLVAYDADGQPETVMYHLLPTLLVAEIQRLEREIAALREAIGVKR